jgi:hypothetical protein
MEQCTAEQVQLQTEDHYQLTSLSWSFLDLKPVRFEPGLSSFGGVRFSSTKRKSDNEHWPQFNRAMLTFSIVFSLVSHFVIEHQVLDALLLFAVRLLLTLHGNCKAGVRWEIDCTSLWLVSK